MKKIGLIGRGVVGDAVAVGMSHAFAVCFYDKVLRHYIHGSNGEQHLSIKNVVEVVDGPIFLCLPTPMQKDGSADISVIEGVIKEINELERDRLCDIPAKRGKPEKVLIIKSTVPPGTTEVMNSRYEYVYCVFNPEFLRESTALEDFKNQDRIIIGGPHKAVSIVKRMYQIAYPEVPTTKTSSTIAEMVKYVTNCFLATKIAFANEISQICSKLSIDYDKVVEYATKDKRLGTSHWAVPGPDGHMGFGLTCFPKDLNALMNLAKKLRVDPKVMDAVWQKNLEVRPEKDWEQLKGRAVTNIDESNTIER
jgi:UDPglucose 6-dehydrogenase